MVSCGELPGAKGEGGEGGEGGVHGGGGLPNAILAILENAMLRFWYFCKPVVEKYPWKFLFNILE